MTRKELLALIEAYGDARASLADAEITLSDSTGHRGVVEAAHEAVVEALSKLESRALCLGFEVRALLELPAPQSKKNKKVST